MSKPKESAERTILSPEETVKSLQKKFGKETVSEGGSEEISFVPTGIIGLDNVLGGGIPKGRIIEIFGASSSGKSSTCLYLAGVMQKAGNHVAWLDLENAWSAKFSAGLGVDIQKVVLMTPESGEDAFTMIDELARGGFGLIIVDSVSALVPRKEIDNEYGDQQMALQARLMSQGLRKLQGVLARTGSVCIFLNQVRDAMNASPYGPKTITTGGKALPFYASVRIETSRVETVKEEKGTDNEKALGIVIKFKGAKNKTGIPFKMEQVYLDYRNGFDLTDSLLRMAERLEVVKKAGSSYSFGDRKLGVGFDKTKDVLNSDEELKKEIETATRIKMNE